ncbi:MULTISPECIES: hypothetical protein [unclassified Leifsonia]|uniref:hypothetical protein n=1 Tax=unclassified Leifsonia TaxID=2663824 RepID=UPI0008A7B5E2|nr:MULTISPECIES: hypothetical protein [unclassified Leifsonia]SEH59369.1 hypothetical protein SAMN04515694_101278 [Leifsonia sp. CL154]SFL19718.1 hypothetical protein SAMN04515692_101201 [Leifsonia sp. CL147]
MTDDTGRPPESGERHWERVFTHPDVERVKQIGDVVRVRLRSGIELEWPTASVRPATRGGGPG